MLEQENRPHKAVKEHGAVQERESLRRRGTEDLGIGRERWCEP